MASAKFSLPRWLRLMLVLLAAGVLAGVLEAAYIVRDGQRDNQGKADVALVLGNAVEKGGKPSALLQERLDRAVQGYHDGAYPLLIVSGGIDPIGGDEAAAMRNYLVEQGIPADRIITDNHGVNTFESARFTARLLRERRWRSVCVVTHYYHVPRSRLALHRFGVGAVSSLHAGSFAGDGFSFHLVREMAGLAKYAVRPYRL